VYSLFGAAPPPPPPPGTELVVNGAFAGSASPWTLSGNAYWSTGGYPHSGTGYTVLGYHSNASGSKYQTVSIPPDHPAKYTFWLKRHDERVRLDHQRPTLRRGAEHVGRAARNARHVQQRQRDHAGQLLAEGVQPGELASSDGAAPVQRNDRRHPPGQLPYRRRVSEVGLLAGAQSSSRRRSNGRNDEGGRSAPFASERLVTDCQAGADSSPFRRACCRRPGVASPKKIPQSRSPSSVPRWAVRMM
jgi:hypothetical protein